MLDLSTIIVFGLILLGFAALSLARGSERRTKMQHELASAEIDRARKEREQSQKEIAQAILESESKAANERALVLSKARDEALLKIQMTDLQSKNDLLAKIGERGGLWVEFSDGDKEIEQGIPKVSWKWLPFQNAVIKIYRNEGGILEDVRSVMKNAQLIHVVQHDAEGFYSDREASPEHTYNYYAFIETRRTGIKAEAVTLGLPDDVRAGKIIDDSGKEITAFDTFKPTTYEEPFYDGFCYRRVTVRKWKDNRAKRKEELSNRREDLELHEEELELEKLEKQIGLRSGRFDTDHIRLLIAEAKELANRGSIMEKAESILAEDETLDNRQREIILEYIKKQSYR